MDASDFDFLDGDSSLVSRSSEPSTPYSASSPKTRRGRPPTPKNSSEAPTQTPDYLDVVENPVLNFSYSPKSQQTSGPTHISGIPAAKNNTVVPLKLKKDRLESGDMRITADVDSMVVTESQFNPYIPTEASFDPRLAFEVALGIESPAQICTRYDLSEAEWELLSVYPPFKKSVLTHQTAILEEGIGFRMKAKVQAEAYLKDAHLLIKNPTVPPSVRADMIKWMAKVADLEPRKDGPDQGPTFNLQINL